MTARAVGRETVEAALSGRVGEFSYSDGNSGESASVQERGASGAVLRDVTRINLEKVLRYRSEEDKQRFRQLAADWAVRRATSLRNLALQFRLNICLEPLIVRTNICWWTAPSREEDPH
jgi:hypothetical protein